VVVGIIVGAVLVVLVVVMKWADRRDRAKGHVNRKMGDIRSTIRQDRLNTQALRRGGGRGGVPTPHEFRGKQRRRG
jgi:FtsZ-interacting cell division protein ZipA